MTIDKLEGCSTGVSAAHISMSVYVHDKRIVAPANAQIYNITGQNVTHFNGQLSKGIYVVRCDKQTVKVVVK